MFCSQQPAASIRRCWDAKTHLKSQYWLGAILKNIHRALSCRTRNRTGETGQAKHISNHNFWRHFELCCCTFIRYNNNPLIKKKRRGAMCCHGVPGSGRGWGCPGWRLQTRPRCAGTGLAAIKHTPTGGSLGLRLGSRRVLVGAVRTRRLSVLGSDSKTHLNSSFFWGLAGHLKGGGGGVFLFFLFFCCWAFFFFCNTSGCGGGGGGGGYCLSFIVCR